MNYRKKARFMPGSNPTLSSPAPRTKATVGRFCRGGKPRQSHRHAMHFLPVYSTNAFSSRERRPTRRARVSTFVFALLRELSRGRWLPREGPPRRPRSFTTRARISSDGQFLDRRRPREGESLSFSLSPLFFFRLCLSSVGAFSSDSS